jgi:polyketide cyclase/dehydrase/lipid transport protein
MRDVGHPDENMRRLKRLLLVGAVLIAAFVTVVAVQPDDYRLTRQIMIAAPAAAIFPRVNDLRQWEEWSPWAELDPNAKISLQGPLAGPGAMFHWSGNLKVGAGTMTITESKPNQRIATRTDFTRPFEGTGNSDFIFSPSGDQTNVIWTMSGKLNFISKAMSLVMGGMDRTLGPDFEKGLAQLKEVSEK